VGLTGLLLLLAGVLLLLAAFGLWANWQHLRSGKPTDWSDCWVPLGMAFFVMAVLILRNILL
jgi:hypothetical protein